MTSNREPRSPASRRIALLLAAASIVLVLQLLSLGRREAAPEPLDLPALMRQQDAADSTSPAARALSPADESSSGAGVGFQPGVALAGSAAAAEVPADTAGYVECRRRVADRSLEELLECIAWAREAPEAAWPTHRRLLVELASFGSPEALDHLARLFADETYLFSHRAMCFAEALEDVRERRFAAIALMWLDRELAKDDPAIHEATESLRVLVRNGGGIGGRKLLELLQEDSLSSTRMVVDVVADLQDRSIAPQLFEFARSGDPSRLGVLDGMAQWGDAAVFDELLAMAKEPGLNVRTRREALEVYGSRMSASDLSRMLVDFDVDRSTAGRRRVLNAIRGARDDERLADAELNSGAGTFLADCLNAADADTRRLAREVVQSNDRLTSVYIDRMLDQLTVDDSLDLAEREECRYLLSHVRRR